MTPTAARNEISCQSLARNSNIPINWLLRFARGLNDKRLESCCMYAIPGEIGIIWFLRYVRCECNIEESLDHEWRIEYLIRGSIFFRVSEKSDRTIRHLKKALSQLLVITRWLIQHELYHLINKNVKLLKLSSRSFRSFNWQKYS